MRKIKIFDTTLRDGEQTPGATMTISEKIKIAKQLELLGVDIIEAGFAAASKADFLAIQTISKELEKPIICSLARALEKDIEIAGKSLENAKNKRIHTFIATSDIHLEHKLKMTKDEAIKQAVKSISFAKTFTNDIQFSLEDATRTDLEFLLDFVEAIIEAGVTTVNLPDTVGIRTPREIGLLISHVKNQFDGKIDFSVHNHNDLGLATANSLEGILCGANQVECTINGIGERAGNASLEEIIVSMMIKRSFFKDVSTNINLKEIYPTSRLVSYITGIEPQPNKAIVGKNAFAHESGIHQDGFLKKKETYQIFNPELIGKTDNTAIQLGKLSGKAALKDKIKSLGFNIEEIDIEEVFFKFKKLADYKKEIFDEDIIALISNDNLTPFAVFKRVDYKNDLIVFEIDKREESFFVQFSNSGIINELFLSIDEFFEIETKLLDYSVRSVTRGKDSLANTFVKVLCNGTEYVGHGLNIDTIVSSCEAYTSIINQILEK